MDFLKNLANSAKSLLSNLLPQQQPQQPFVSPGEGFIGPIPPGSPGGAGFIGPVQRGTPDIRFPQPQQQRPQVPSSGTGAFTGATNTPTTNFQLPDATTFANNLIQSVVPTLQQEIGSWWKRLSDYDKSHPFAFDEALARAGAGERLNPFYDAELNDFMTGIRRSNSRSLEDRTRTIGELNADATKLSSNERLATEEAIRKSEEGFAGAGLFFSGRRERAAGLEGITGAQRQGEIQTNLQQGVGEANRTASRTLEDNALRQARKNRLLEASRTTSLETDIAKQKQEAELQRGLERLQFAGKVPGASPIDQMNLENNFLSGLRG